MTEIMPVPRILILLSYQQGAIAAVFVFLTFFNVALFPSCPSLFRVL